MAVTQMTIPQFTLGDRLAKALDVSGTSVTEMAETLGVSRQTIGNYLAGRTHPKLAVLRVWADVTHVPVEWLRDGSETETPRMYGPSRSVQLSLLAERFPVSSDAAWRELTEAA